MSSKPKILSIDDNEANQTLLKMSIKEFDLQLAMSGEEGLKILETETPDIILMDIAMPGMNGWETCQAIKENPNTRHIPVLFVSALNTLEDRLSSYRAGGEDYISKPIDINELKHKIQILLAIKLSVAMLDARLKSANSVAMTAMSNSSELGVIIQFMENSLRCKGLEALSSIIFEALEQYGLNGSMVIRPENSEQRFFSNAVLTPLETQLLDMSRDGARIVTIGKRAIFNSPLLSLLIKDMPEKDTERMGRLRDHIAMLLTLSEARVESLLNEELAQKYRSSSVHQAVTEASKSVAHVEKTMKMFQQKAKNIMDHLMLDMESELLKLMLEEQAESTLLDLIRHAQEKLDDTFDESIEIDHLMDNLTSILKNSLTS